MNDGTARRTVLAGAIALLVSGLSASAGIADAGPSIDKGEWAMLRIYAATPADCWARTENPAQSPVTRTSFASGDRSYSERMDEASASSRRGATQDCANENEAGLRL
jgi:hypothetical protein